MIATAAALWRALLEHCDHCRTCGDEMCEIGAALAADWRRAVLRDRARRP